MRPRLIIHWEAEAEIAEAFDWYEDCNPGLGSEFLLCLDAVFNSIQRAPQQHPFVYKSAQRALMRRFPYMIIFIEHWKRIVVLAVFHAKRNPQSWQERV